MKSLKKSPISLFIPMLNGGGAQRVVVNLANALVELTDRPIHIVLVRKEGEFLGDLCSEVTIVDLKCRRTALAVLHLWKYLRQVQPITLMSSMNYVNIIAVVAYILAGKPGRLVLREATVIKADRKTPSLRHKALIFFMRMTYRHASALVANSEDTLKALVDAGVRLPSDKFVIGNPVMLPTVQSPGYLLPGGKPYICAVGRLVHLKGFDFLIEAFAKSKYQDLNLVILGQGPMHDSLLSLAQSLNIADRVHLLGFINPPASVMQNAQALVLSSRWEGFGNVLVEALALGIPIVSTDCPGGVRTILMDGCLGKIVPIDDLDAMAKAIDDTIFNPCGSPEDRKSRARDFDPTRITKEYLNRVLLPPANGYEN